VAPSQKQLESKVTIDHSIEIFKPFHPNISQSLIVKAPDSHPFHESQPHPKMLNT
jgi:hypothetical protein